MRCVSCTSYVERRMLRPFNYLNHSGTMPKTFNVSINRFANCNIYSHLCLPSYPPPTLCSFASRILIKFIAYYYIVAARSSKAVRFIFCKRNLIEIHDFVYDVRHGIIWIWIELLFKTCAPHTILMIMFVQHFHFGQVNRASNTGTFFMSSVHNCSSVIKCNEDIQLLLM